MSVEPAGIAAAGNSFADEKSIAEPPAYPVLDDKDLGISETSHEDGRRPTDEELKTLRRVADKIPMSIYTIAFVELCERFSYYGTTAVFTNFIQHPLPPGSTTGADFGNGQAGALGLGQQTSTALTTFNAFWQYTMPLFGAYVADAYLGRFKTIAVALVIGIIGHIILIMSALPPVIKNPDGAMAPFIIGIILMGLGTGGFKPNINPLIVEQLDLEKMTVKKLPSGELVIVDPTVTASRVYHYFYMFINVGALVGQIGMVYCEYYVGFWLSYTLPTIMLCICPLVMLWGRRRYKRVPPEGSVLGKAIKLILRATKGRWSINPVQTWKNMHADDFWENVKPSKMDPATKPKWMNFSDACEFQPLPHALNMTIANRHARGR
jgi:POT family proton-dependent oligopeptide transporter